MAKRIIEWVLALVPAFIFFQSLFFKFSGSEETTIIFNTIAEWMQDITLLSSLARPFAAYGGTVIGLIELCAGIALLIPVVRGWGGLVGLGVISGAIFFHLFTPLGVVRIVDAAGNTDGGALFIMACIAWLCCAATVGIKRNEMLAVFR